MRTHRGHPTATGDFWASYTDFPDLYDRFAISTLHAVRIVHETVDFGDARVLDVASGTGKNAVAHARIARSVVGIEPMPKMREFAIARVREAGLTNVEFRDGIAEDLSAFEDDAFDIAVSMHGAPFPWDAEDKFMRGCDRVVRRGGHVLIVGTTPGWSPLHTRSRSAQFGDPNVVEAMNGLRRFGFEARDYVVDLDYGSEREALETFGFIYAPAAIDYILDNQTAHQEWSLRVYVRRLL